MLPDGETPISLGRIRPIGRVVLTLLAGLVAANCILLLFFGRAPQLLRRTEVLDPSEYERIGARASREESLRAATEAGHASPLLVVVGLSTAREDIDASLLGEGFCGGARTLNLASSGGSYSELAFYLRSLRAARLHSTLTVVAAHPVWLAGRPQGSRPVSMALTNRPSREVAREIASRWIWLYANRQGMHALLRNALRGARDRIGDEFDFPMRSRFPVGVDSLREDTRAYSGVRAPESFLEEQMRAWTAYGWFDPRQYSADGGEAAALREVVSAARSLGGPVVFVLMPEHSALRRRTPDVAATTLYSILKRDQSPPVLDLRGALPDKEFYDFAHANAVGREHLSTELPILLASAQGCGNPHRVAARPNRD